MTRVGAHAREEEYVTGDIEWSAFCRLCAEIPDGVDKDSAMWGAAHVLKTLSATTPSSPPDRTQPDD